MSERFRFEYPTEFDEPHFPGIDDESVEEALGKVIVWFEDLDEQLAVAISFLLRRGDGVGQVVCAELSFKSKVNLFGALFRHERPKSENLETLSELASSCFQIEEFRNQVVHSKWRTDFGGKGMTRTKVTARHKQGLKRQAETLTSWQVGAIWAHCGYLAHEVDTLMYVEFGSEYGEP